MHTIHSLEIDSFLRLRVVRINPQGSSAVIVGGNNANGKSSVLAAICAALGGKDMCPEDPIHHGDTRATIKLTLRSGLIVERKFLASGGTSLKVTGPEGQFTSPQSVLNALLGEISFDPLAFSRMKKQDRADLVMKVAGLDLCEANSVIESCYDTRRLRSKDAREKRSLAAQHPVIDGAVEPISVSQVSTELQQTQARNKQRMDADAVVQKVIDKGNGLKAEIERELKDGKRLASRGPEIDASIASLEEQIRALQRQCEALDQQKMDLAQQMATQGERFSQVQASLDAAKKEYADVIASREVLGALEDEQPLLQKIRDAEQHNASLVRSQQAQQCEADAVAAEQASAAAEADLAAARDARDTLIRGAKMPLEGLGFNNDGELIYQGVLFDQASSAQQIQVGMSIALVTLPNPGIRIILIRDGSLLDDEMLSAVVLMAEANNAQVVIERVGKGKECTVVLNDGEVE